MRLTAAAAMLLTAPVKFSFGGLSTFHGPAGTDGRELTAAPLTRTILQTGATS